MNFCSLLPCYLIFLLLYLVYFTHLGFHQQFDALASDPLCRDAIEENRPSEQQEEDSEEESNARHDLLQLQLPEDEDEDEDEVQPGAGQLH